MDKRLKRILLVDDEARIVEILEKFLTISGFFVVTANDAAGVRDVIAKKGPVDLVIIDAKMPGMSGEDFVRELKDKEKNTPVILLTGSIHILPSNSRNKGLYDMVLFKPIRLAELLESVRHVLSRAAASNPKKRKK